MPYTQWSRDPCRCVRASFVVTHDYTPVLFDLKSAFSSSA